MNEDENNHEFPEGEAGEGHAGSDQLSSARPAVAAAPGKVLLIAGMAAVLLFFVIKSLFFSKKETVYTKPPVEHVTAAPSPPPQSVERAQPQISVPPEPPLDKPPAIEDQKLPPPTPPDLQINTQSTPTDQQMKARIRSPMLIGGGKSASSNTTEKKKATPSDPNAAWEDSVTQSEAETVEATQVKHLDRTLVQGKIVEGILETAIDSTLGGDCRAIVSHDTYAENGRTILIPKGSRIVGKYNSAVKRGQGRVFIVWTRVIRPDGVDVAINSPGVDALGRAGLEGFVDDHYFEAFSTALLTSSIDIATAAVGDSLFGSQQQTQANQYGGSTITQSPSSQAMQTAIQNLGTVGQSIVGNVLNITPTVHVDQGQQINIFVNKDVVFPSAGSVLVQ